MGVFFTYDTNCISNFRKETKLKIDHVLFTYVTSFESFQYFDSCILEYSSLIHKILYNLLNYYMMRLWTFYMF